MLQDPITRRDVAVGTKNAGLYVLFMTHKTRTASSALLNKSSFNVSHELDIKDLDLLHARMGYISLSKLLHLDGICMSDSNTKNLFVIHVNLPSSIASPFPLVSPLLLRPSISYMLIFGDDIKLRTQAGHIISSLCLMIVHDTLGYTCYKTSSKFLVTFKILYTMLKIILLQLLNVLGLIMVQKFFSHYAHPFLTIMVYFINEVYPEHPNKMVGLKENIGTS